MVNEPIAPRRTREPACVAVEPLERRALLNAQPAGPEFTVTERPNVSERLPAVAADADGDFVVVWKVEFEDHVYARQFDKFGAPRGPEFRVSQSATGTVSIPAVAMDDDGDFVVTWWGRNTAGAPGYVNGRRYSAAGVPQGNQFVIDSGVGSPVVAMDADGDFAVAYMSGSLYVRRFNAAGVGQGSPTVLATNRDTPAFQSIAMDKAGDFVVAWQQSSSSGTDADLHTRMQRFDAAGVPQGSPILVNPSVPAPYTRYQTPKVAVDDDGDIAVAWHGNGAGGMATYARLYTAGGQAKGAAFQVFDVDTMPDGIAMDSDGDFVVVAECPEESYFQDPHGICARRFLRDGTPAGPAFRVNNFAEYNQENASVASSDSGEFVVAWDTFNRQATDTDISARRFVPEGPESVARVVGRYAFYRDSAYDNYEGFGRYPGDAIATDKSALLPGQRPTFANVTSYDKGLNGIVVDVEGLPQDVSARVTADHFDFGGAAAPMTVWRRRGAGVGGSDRIVLRWADYNPIAPPASMAVGDGWLTVTLKANARTALAEPDTFSFGNLVGETGDGTGAAGWRVGALDLAAAKRNLASGNLPITASADFDRNGFVNALDLATVRRHLNHSLPPPPPPATTTANASTRRAAEDLLS